MPGLLLSRSELCFADSVSKLRDESITSSLFGVADDDLEKEPFNRLQGKVRPALPAQWQSAPGTSPKTGPQAQSVQETQCIRGGIPESPVEISRNTLGFVD